MRTAQWIVVVMLALATAVVVPAVGSADGTVPDCAGVYPEPYVYPENCLCWPCRAADEPQRADA